MVLLVALKAKRLFLRKICLKKGEFVGECIERRLGRGKSCLNIVHSWKFSSSPRMYKQRKLMKYGLFKVSRNIDEKDHKFEVQDDLVLYYKFHPLDRI